MASHVSYRVAALSRRHLLAGASTGIALVMARSALVAAEETGATPAAAPLTGEWSFTDDAGNTVTLPERPQRIVADLNAASALWDFGIRPIAVSGWTTNTDAAWGNVNRKTPDISASLEAPEPNIEDLLNLGADLFVTVTWGDEESPYSWSFADPAAFERTSQIVPVVAISATGMADANTARFAELAGLLGADLDAPELATAKADYDAAVAEFETLASEKAGLTSLFVYADGEFEYVANPEDWADLAMYQTFGLNIVAPDVAPGEYWQELSPEQAMMYPSDVLFQSTRAGVFTFDELTAHPTYGQLPAVAAGQIGPWNQDFIQSYQGLTAALKSMIAILQDAEDVTPAM